METVAGLLPAPRSPLCASTTTAHDSVPAPAVVPAAASLAPPALRASLHERCAGGKKKAQRWKEARQSSRQIAIVRHPPSAGEDG